MNKRGSGMRIYRRYKVIGSVNGVQKLFISFCIFVVLGCKAENDPAEGSRTGRSTEEKLMLYLPTCEPPSSACVGQIDPLQLTTRLPLPLLLDSLGAVLSRSFFADYGDRRTDVRFKIYSIEEIATPSGVLRVAVIDIIDTAEIAMRTFFQGSAGASATKSVLTANFFQPQLRKPLLAGAVFLYNGDTMTELAHLDLSGIQTPKGIDPRVEMLMRRHQPETS
ncbi:MAG: hypothetical protein GF344_19110 [Chitinivibrionales bacterium]|nr:hypothetical protein [Chitinivibrionales bacterium]MBD3358735.1 hypothetical protein [Chitinivibrionales bacterium]